MSSTLCTKCLLFHAGIGIAWTLAAVVNTIRGEKFEVKAGSLGFSVTLFVVFAIIAICIILIRRSKAVGE